MSQPDNLTEKDAGQKAASTHHESAGKDAGDTKPAPKLAIWIATGFGLGYLPIAPGTWGSLGGIVATYLFVHLWSSYAAIMKLVDKSEVTFLPAEGELFGLFKVTPAFAGHLLGTVLLGVAGVWASRVAMSHFAKPDPGPVVVDEISGQQITYLPVLAVVFNAGGWKYLLLGFILFRVFDVVKPWPCKQAERWPNGWGIMADDWFAGLYAAAILWAVHGIGWLG